ncbi:MAG: prepilin-type N-terminal cleavage/methylation domain-containing protein [Elusimicrobia bacterium]|nr:prepilin-type N-terminal cleavage/methylation domain-containing protein [Elusimicrobiota bacterium]
MKKFLKGFTLVELIIVITLVTILSMISVPIYKDYIVEAKMAEGYALLNQIKEAQMQYYATYENFFWAYDENKTYWTCNSEVLGVNARLNKYFTLFCSNQRNSSPYSLSIGVAEPKELGGKWIYLYYSLTDSARTFESVSNW